MSGMPRRTAADETAAVAVTREQLLARRVLAQQLDPVDRRRSDVDLLDLGVQDTGPDGARWALELRGSAVPDDELVHAWTVRGAPHTYRRRQIAQVATATRPWDDDDAAKRVFDAARSLGRSGTGTLAALDRVAGELRDIVREPTVKGTVSREVSARLPDDYLWDCRSCGARHVYEQPFRLAALQAGLELEPGTSPPVLRRIPRWRGPAKTVAPELDLVRAVLHHLGPATPKQVAGYLDTSVAAVEEHWPRDTVPVRGEGVAGELLAADAEQLPHGKIDLVALLAPFDGYLQGRDREFLVPDAAARKDLWRVLGRPGAVLVDGELVGSWRGSSKGGKLRLAVTLWSRKRRPAGLAEQAERLAAFRGLEFAGFD